MFAANDAFWKWPSVYDVITVVGLAMGLASIWYAWYLARRQLRADLRKAAAEAVDVLSRFVLGGDLAEAVRFLREADRWLADKNWEIGVLRLDDAAATMARFSEHAHLKEEDKGRLTELVTQVRSLSQATRSHARSKSNRGHLPQDLTDKVGTIVVELERMRGRLLASTIPVPK